MYTEFEATFANVSQAEARKRLVKAGAKLVKPEFLMKRITFNLPVGNELSGGWLRVRDEGDQITMSLKIIDGKNITDQREICLKVDDFNQAVELLEFMGARRKAYQESRREIWHLNNVEICLDEWPYLEPFVEVEGQGEAEVKDVSQKLGFDYNQAQFGAVSLLYNKKYSLSEDEINNNIARITFDEPNPFRQR